MVTKTPGSQLSLSGPFGHGPKLYRVSSPGTFNVVEVDVVPPLLVCFTKQAPIS